MPWVPILRRIPIPPRVLRFNTNVPIKDLTTAVNNLAGSLHIALRSLNGHGDRFDGQVAHALEYLTRVVDYSPDLIVRSFQIGTNWRWPALIAFIHGLASDEMVDQDTVERLMDTQPSVEVTAETVFAAAKRQLITVGHVTTSQSWSDIRYWSTTIRQRSSRRCGSSIFSKLLKIMPCRGGMARSCD